MQKFYCYITCLVFVVCFSGCLGIQTEQEISIRIPDSTITLNSLLEEMLDRSSLTRVSTPNYSLGQFSSYDRNMKSPDEGWYANDDRNHFLRKEETDGRTEWVLFDQDGPGCIVRFWATWNKPEGNLRFYFDNEKTPAFVGPVQDMIGGDFFVGKPPICCSFTR